MAVKTFTQAEQLTAADTNTYLNNGGLVYITQASMTTQFTSINNCFTSTYRNYRLVVSMTACSNNTSWNLRFRASGADNATANYKFALSNVSTAGGTGVTTGNANNEITLAFIGTANGDTSTIIDIHDPQIVARTKGSAYFMGYDSANWVSRAGGIFFDQTNQFDGFSLFAGAGTVTGVVQVYGYRNS